MLSARQLREYNHQQPAPQEGTSHVLPLQPGQAVPWADLGRVRVGQSKHHLVVLHNTAAEEQVASIDQLPPDFSVRNASGQLLDTWEVPGSSSSTLHISFTPTREGRVRGVLVFNFAGGAEAGRLAVSAVAVGDAKAALPAGPGALVTRQLSRPPAPRLPLPSQVLSDRLPSLPAGQHGEKRVRAAAGLATPRGAASTTIPAMAANLNTPSLQPAKKARDMGSSRAGTVPPPAAAAGRGLGPWRAPDPATPTHAVMRLRDQPPGSVEENTPGAGPVVPRLQLGQLRASPGAAAAASAPLGSSRFAQELAVTSSFAAPPSSRPGGSPAPGSANKGALVGKTFTHFHTSLWMDKQETAFKAWLNTILLPATSDQQGDGGQAALASRRLTAKMRGLLWRIYQRDEQFRDVMLRVEQRVEGGHLRIRDEESCLKNLKEQSRVKEVLLSYHPFWLRLGMEVVVHRAAAGSDTMLSQADLEVFMREHFLRDPELAKGHAPNRAVNGLLPKAYWVQLGQLVLSRLLLLVALLDRAMVAQALPQGVPLLFALRGKVKGSAQVLQAILPGWLSGEGDLLRSLGRLGYKLQYEQQPKRELSFAVTNLAVDLRDGLRLCKLADTLLGTERLFEQARFPTDKRPVKLHNVQLALGEFMKAGLSLEGMKTLKGPSSLQPMDIIDGDREKTLSLLWRLILLFQLPQLVDPAAVRMELDRVALGKTASSGSGGNGRSGSRLGGSLAHAGASLGRSVDHVSLLLEWVQAVCAEFGEAVTNFTTAFADGHVFCLLVHFYLGPAYMPRKDIYIAAATAGASREIDSPATSEDDEDDAGWRAMHRGEASSDPAQAAHHRQGVAHNFDLVHRVAEALGGVPIMVSAQDILEHGPDEKAVVLFTAFLCRRLLEMSREERAAMVVQRLWRRRQLHKPGTARAHLHRWIHAASVVQCAARVWLLRRGLQRFAEGRRRFLMALTRLQAAWRARPYRRQYLQLRAAALHVQAVYRGKAERRRVFEELVLPDLLARGLQQKRRLESSRYQGRLLAAAVAMQARRRGSAQRRKYLRQQAAAVQIQAAVRRRQASCSYQQLRSAAVAAVRIQRHYRGHAVCQQLKAQHAAATDIQACWRAYNQRQAFLQQRAAAVALQAATRAWSARRSFLQLRQASITLQQYWRGYAVRQHLVKERRAATAIQAAWRCYTHQQQLARLKAAAIFLQSLVRRNAAMQRLAEARHAAVCIQRQWRGYTVRSHLVHERQAAITIQAAWRCCMQRRRFSQLRGAAILLQSLARRNTAVRYLQQARQAAVCMQRHARGLLARRQLQQQHAACVRIQAAWRAKRGRLHFLRQKQAAILLQAHVRRSAVQRRYQQLKAAAVCVQSCWRARQARLLLRRHKAARSLQSLWRGYSMRRQLQQQQTAATRLQAAWRGSHALRHFQRQKQATILLQAQWRAVRARQRYQQLRAAAICLQGSWRARQARLLLRQHKAARSVQCVWRGHAVRMQLEQQRAAATLLQAHVRGTQARKQYMQLRGAALCFQSAWRARQARRLLKEHRAARTVQRVWRGHRLRMELQKQRTSAVVVQSAWRGFATRRWLQQTQAATTIQRYGRGFLVRRQAARNLEAAIIIQRSYRRHLDWKRQRAIEAMTRQMRELAATMQLYTKRAAAALRIQAVWRGYTARKVYALLVWEHQEKLRLERQRQAAALAVIAPWAGVFRDRVWFLRARRAVRVLQGWWRKQHAQRTAAAVTMQAAARRYLAVRRLDSSKRAATLVQAVWRGWQVRAGHPKAKRMAELRRRLARAHAGAVGLAHRSLAGRTGAALEGLLACTHLGSATPHLEALAACTEASNTCCDMVAAAGGMAVLLRLVQSGSRDKSCQEALRYALLCLANLCRQQGRAEEVFEEEGLLGQLAKLLADNREREEVFLATCLLLQRLVADPVRARALSRQGEVMAKCEGVARMLATRLGQEHKYLSKLEGQKGSDASARQSTRALVSLGRMAHQLKKVLAATGAPILVAPVAAPASPGEGEAPLTLGKNTIVRRTLAELQLR
ncbi:hypothetical protein N2152v2_001793 [Parachlorella kessleri]